MGDREACLHTSPQRSGKNEMESVALTACKPLLPALGWAGSSRMATIRRHGTETGFTAQGHVTYSEQT